MDLYLKDDCNWCPPLAHQGEMLACLVVTNEQTGIRILWKVPPLGASNSVAIEFLNRRSRSMSEMELCSLVNFLYVVIRRVPKGRESPSDIGIDTPIAEFGYGAPPSSPEEWPLLPLRDLLERVVSSLGYHSMPSS